MIHVDAEPDDVFRKKLLLTYISTFRTLNFSLGLKAEDANSYSRTSITITTKWLQFKQRREEFKAETPDQDGLQKDGGLSNES